MHIIAKPLAAVCLHFLDPILSLHMEELGWSEDDTGFVFALYALTWAIGSLMAGCICQHVNRRVVIFLSFITLSMSLLLVGPSAILGLPLSNQIVLPGFILLGFSVAGCYVPLIPEIVDAVAEIEN